jgi:hypothetical protein
MDQAAAKRYIQSFDFKRLFREVLGWDKLTLPLQVEVDGQAFTLEPVAQKRGVVALLHTSAGAIPPHSTRIRIERQVARSHRQHLLIYVDGQQQQQVWLWVRQEPGKPLASRDHRYHAGQPGEALAQKLQGIAFSLEEEDGLTHVDVTSRVRASFDLDRATRRFYDQFKRERDAFQEFLKGIPDDDMARWYVSVMLNRLMFIYFIQKKGFLDGDPDYLRHKLQESRGRGPDRYYRDLLCPLFFEGFARPADQRSPAALALLGDVPYLNGGIFQQHQVEQLHGQAIQLPDAAFQQLFDFFDGYQWHLDDRPLRNDNEINPDVLGYIFEKYINQKQMGAYYTKEDITEYIGRNTIVPFLLDEVRRHYRRAFQGDGSVWRLLQDDPDRYIYPAMRDGFLAEDGTNRPLPPEVAAGIDDVGQRSLWNTPTPEPFALPTEIWRETVARRLRYEEVWKKLASGEVREVNDLVTYNLDIQQFAQDVVETCDDPDLLRALWKSIQNISVLDPTCGSGAFLFAALNILEPLYEACLARMAAFVDELEPGASPQKYGDFRLVLDQVKRHPNRRYFVLKSIVVNNLYGVDIMAEAVEIARLRLFLKLVAQVETAGQVEPLPDIDFNIQAGNTLVGFTSREQVQAALRNRQVGAGVSQGRLMFGEDEAQLREIEEQAEAVERLYRRFRKMQTAYDMSDYSQDFADTKGELRQRLKVLEDKLNGALAGQYGVDAGQAAAYQKWLDSHQPFHWFLEFYGIMRTGGFHVIIGNPPYVEMSKITGYKLRDYATGGTGNIYAPCVERSAKLLCNQGTFGMIVPLSGFSTDRMQPYQDTLSERYKRLHISYFSGDAHPSVMFNGVKYRLCIVIAGSSGPHLSGVHSTDYLRWYADERSVLFPVKVSHGPPTEGGGFLRYAKIGSSLASQVLHKMLAQDHLLGRYLVPLGPGHINYHRSPVFWIRSMTFEPYFRSLTRTRSLDHLKDLYFVSISRAKRAAAILNSTCFYFWFSVQGNCRNITFSDIERFPIGDFDGSSLEELEVLLDKLMDDYAAKSRRRIYNYSTGPVEYDEFYPSQSKRLLDQIDIVLGKHYGFSDEELDFMLNYDIKYRMGDQLLEEEDEQE